MTDRPRITIDLTNPTLQAETLAFQQTVVRQRQPSTYS